MQIQLLLGEPDEEGRRALTIHSRTEQDSEGEWARNASGTLAPASAPLRSEDLSAWPPPGAEPLDVELLYDQLAEHGFHYGPAFQGLSAAWRGGDEVFAEVELGEEQGEEAQPLRDPPGPARRRAPRQLSHRKRSRGAPALRLERRQAEHPQGRLAAGPPRPGRRGRAHPQRRRWGGGARRLDREARHPPARAESADRRRGAPAPTRSSASSGPRRRSPPAPLRAWRPWAGFEPRPQRREPPRPRGPGRGDRRGTAPDVVLADCRFAPAASESPAVAAHAATAKALALVQAWLGSDRLASSRLALLSEGAVATSPGEGVADLPAAACWGLLRSAQSEHPGRFALIDTDGSEASWEALGSALGAEQEPQLALREGRGLAPRLARGAPEAVSAAARGAALAARHRARGRAGEPRAARLPRGGRAAGGRAGPHRRARRRPQLPRRAARAGPRSR